MKLNTQHKRSKSIFVIILGVGKGDSINDRVSFKFGGGKVYLERIRRLTRRWVPLLISQR